MAARGGKSKKGSGRRQAKTIALNKQYRHEAARLKELGVLSAKVNARKNISRATRTKINKFRSVLEGKEIAVRAKPEIRRKYSDKGLLHEQGAFLLVPKQYETQKAKIARGMVQVTRPLKNGTEEYVILPFKYNVLDQLISRMKEDSAEVDALKEPDEMFTFRLFGHDLSGKNTLASFIDADEMAEALQYYKSRFGRGMEEVQFITFQRFKGFTNPMGGTPIPSKERKYYSPVNATGRNYKIEGTLLQQKRRREAARKAKERKKETPDQREARLAKQRIRSAQNRQRKFDEK